MRWTARKQVQGSVLDPEWQGVVAHPARSGRASRSFVDVQCVAADSTSNTPNSIFMLRQMSGKTDCHGDAAFCVVRNDERYGRAAQSVALVPVDRNRVGRCEKTPDDGHDRRIVMRQDSGSAQLPAQCAKSNEKLVLNGPVCSKNKEERVTFETNPLEPFRLALSAGPGRNDGSPYIVRPPALKLGLCAARTAAWH
jgi:hypothetical protein